MTWPDGYGRVILRETGSTLDEGVRLAGGKETTPFWLLAHHQSAARGRRGRVWSMPKGNFAATLVMRAMEKPGQMALRSFVMSLALYRALVEVTGRETVFSLKWPNDVLMNGGKLAGILLETGGGKGRTDVLAIGVGVNLADAPTTKDVEPEALRPVSLARDLGVSIGTEDFLAVLARHYAPLEADFGSFGFQPIRTQWLAHAARLGETITARTPNEEIAGIFEDVDGQGHLVLRAPDGMRKIPAADVYF